VAEFVTQMAKEPKMADDAYNITWHAKFDLNNTHGSEAFSTARQSRQHPFLQKRASHGVGASGLEAMR
jgi:hypothetical protein